MTEKKKVLIVEDEAPLRMALVDKFNLEGFDVLEAPNGRIGLQQALRGRPDIILLDLNMPDMDGLTMVEELQKLEGAEKTPLMVLTNSSATDTIVDVMSHGITDHLVKSDWSINDIVKKVKDKLKI